MSAAAGHGPACRECLQPGTGRGSIAAMQHACAPVHGLLTSAYMAAGMTSRARRPEAHVPLG